MFLNSFVNNDQEKFAAYLQSDGNMYRVAKNQLWMPDMRSPTQNNVVIISEHDRFGVSVFMIASGTIILRILK